MTHFRRESLRDDFGPPRPRLRAGPDEHGERNVRSRAVACGVVGTVVLTVPVLVIAFVGSMMLAISCALFAACLEAALIWRLVQAVKEDDLPLGGVLPVVMLAYYLREDTEVKDHYLGPMLLHFLAPFAFGLLFLGSPEKTDRPPSVAQNASPKPDPRPAPPQGQQPDQPIQQPQPQPQPQPTPRPQPSRSGEQDGLRYTRLPLDGVKLVPCTFWSADRQSFYCLERQTGTIRHIALDKLKQLKTISHGAALWLSPCAEGLLLSLDSASECLVLDPETLEERSRFTILKGFRAVSTWTQSLAYASRHVMDLSGDNPLYVVDVKRRAVLQQYKSGQPALESWFASAIITPDGKYLFGTGGLAFAGFQVDGASVRYVGSTKHLTDSFGITPPITASVDSKWVTQRLGGMTSIFSTTNLKEPALILQHNTGPREVSFDPVANVIYGMEEGSLLVVYNWQGKVVRDYKLDGKGPGGMHCLVHPAGKKLIVAADSGVYFVELTL